MPPVKKDETALSPELLNAVKSAAQADQIAAEHAPPPPDFIEVDGVRFYRHKVSGVRESAKFTEAKDGTKTPYEWVTLDLAPHANEIRLDGRRYFHGQTYEVAKSVADVLRDQMFRTWQHERQTGGANILSGGRTQGAGQHLHASGFATPGAHA